MWRNVAQPSRSPSGPAGSVPLVPLPVRQDRDDGGRRASPPARPLAHGSRFSASGAAFWLLSAPPNAEDLPMTRRTDRASGDAAANPPDRQGDQATGEDQEDPALNALERPEPAGGLVGNLEQRVMRHDAAL